MYRCVFSGFTDKITSQEKGIWAWIDSNGNLIQNNEMYNNSIPLLIHYSSHNVFASNMVYDNEYSLGLGVEAVSNLVYNNFFNNINDIFYQFSLLDCMGIVSLASEIFINEIIHSQYMMQKIKTKVITINGMKTTVMIPPKLKKEDIPNVITSKRIRPKGFVTTL